MTAITTCKKNEDSSLILDLLAREGAIILEDMLCQERRTRILAELQPYIEGSSRGADEFSGLDTTRTGAIVARSPTARSVVADARVLGLAEAVLGPYCSRIQLMLTQIIRLLPGQGEQVLHRDRFVWGSFLHVPEPQLNTIWALSDFTSENGATRIVPGSSNWDQDRTPEHPEIVQAVMPAGSVLIFTGNVLHGGGKNASSAPRIGLNINYCLGWLRQEENQYLSCPPEIARTLDPSLQDLIGYSMPNFALGYCTKPKLGAIGSLGPVSPAVLLRGE